MTGPLTNVGEPHRPGPVRSGRSRARGPVLLATVGAMLALSACGGSQASDVERAQGRVAAEEQAVAEAQASFDAASAEFCSASASYVAALDRYGNVMAQTPATVGDVTTAGADLAEPQRSVSSSAQATLDARDELANAQSELDEAEAALAEATSGTASSTTTPTTATTSPLLPPATVDRVQQAEADLETAAEGISDQTPLIQAGEAFNAAALALEVAWIRVLVDAGCLTEDQLAQTQAAVVNYTVALQTALTTAGYYDGPIDGVYGPSTFDAVTALQADAQLPQTGIVDRATGAALDAALAAKGGDAVAQSVAYTAAAQTVLTLAGFWTGPVDGKWTQQLTDAVVALQSSLGVPPTGAFDATTLNALRRLASRTDGSTTTSTPVSPTTAPTTSTGTSPASGQ